MLFLLLSGSDDLIQFVFLVFQNRLLAANILLGLLQQLHLLGDLFIGILDMLLSQLDFQLLHLDLLIDRFEFAAVLYILALLIVFLDQRIGLFNGLFLLIDEFLDTVDLFFHAGL